jgi:hypothetical protein
MARLIKKPKAMQPLNIKSHNANRHYTAPHFFVLSKGNNAGKPLDQPCPNCFVITASTVEEKDRLYWLCFGLWQGRQFHSLLIGSVIPFIRLPEFKKCLTEANSKMEMKQEEFNQTIDFVMKLNSQQQRITQQLQLINELKGCLMKKVLQ